MPARASATAAIATADVDAEGHAGEARHDGVVSLDRAQQVGVGILAAVLHRLDERRVDVSRVAGFVDLDVATAGIDALLNHLSLDSDDVLRNASMSA
jgi:hypothetical protein